ncbi:MAG: hypothetical protein JZU65_22580, partial [Chlorobium sp.]|nr:hypothetical protein [Chlorobium sp.]
LLTDQLRIVSEKYGDKYHSAEELLGVVTEEYHELIGAIREGRGQVTTMVLTEMIDLAVACIKGARSYIHGGEKL